MCFEQIILREWLNELLTFDLSFNESMFMLNESAFLNELDE